ncbi:MAG: endoribonuclease MazF [bacterium]|nr:endoribonuclease MazF [bacterium]
MRLRIQKWGNSLALRIPKPFAQEIRARQGSEVDVALVEGKLVVSPVEQEAPNLEELLAGVTRENLPAAVDFGPPVGRGDLVTPGGYVPDRGDAVWISMNPQAGHEQAGRRPALVISPLAYNRKVGLAIMCPITSQVKGYPFEVLINAGAGVGGAILSDQVRSLDWRERRAEFVCRLPAETVAVVLEKLQTLIKPKDE